VLNLKRRRIAMEYTVTIHGARHGIEADTAEAAVDAVEVEVARTTGIARDRVHAASVIESWRVKPDRTITS